MKIIRYLDPDHRVEIRRAPDRTERPCRFPATSSASSPSPDKPATVAKLLAPVAPSSLLCIGLNYRQHAAESKATIPEFPVLFMKIASRRAEPGRSDRPAPASAQRRSRLRGRAGRGDRPHVQERLAAIGRWTTCSAIPAPTTSAPATGKASGAEASGAGEKPSTPSLRSARAWSRPTKSPIPTPWRSSLDINGEVLQDWNTNDMIFDVPRLIEFLSGSTTLPAGHGDPHRHAAGRGLCPQAAPLAQGRRRGHGHDREDRRAEQPRGRRVVWVRGSGQWTVSGGRRGLSCRHPPPWWMYRRPDNRIAVCSPILEGPQSRLPRCDTCPAQRPEESCVVVHTATTGEDGRLSDQNGGVFLLQSIGVIYYWNSGCATIFSFPERLARPWDFSRAIRLTSPRFRFRMRLSMRMAGRRG